MADRFRDLDITRAEIENIGKALKNEEFRKLFVDYCEEISDPASRKQYEEEITQLEKERGIEVKFINPISGYVIKTSVDGNKMAFINICSNEHVEKPTSTPSSKDGSRGVNWSVPHMLSPPREDLNKKGKRCTVFDVIFHPEALNNASNNKQYRDLVNNIACEAVEANHNVSLDKANLKFPKLQYKGVSRPLVIRKRTGEPIQINSEDPIDKMYSDMYEELDEKMANKRPVLVTTQSPVENTSKYATPKYLIKHSTDVDMQDFTYHVDSKMNAATPKELVVEIELPLLKSSSDLQLDVTEKTISLRSEKPSKYKLDLTLPYAVREEEGSAKFEPEQRRLTVRLPVRRRPPPPPLADLGRDDSGVESDNSPGPLPLVEDSDASAVPRDSEVYRTSAAFLDPESHYSLPDYSCHSFNDILVFTLHVKNVDPASLERELSPDGAALQLKFTSVSPAFVPLDYAFYVRLPARRIDPAKLSVEPWDNNVIAQVAYAPSGEPVCSFWAGASRACAQETLLEEPAVIFDRRFAERPEDATPPPRAQIQMGPAGDVSLVLRPADKGRRCCSESSGDELSASPTKGILKLGRARTPVSRSVSESSVDDYTWSSFENCASASASDSLIPETEGSSSMKKTVRFNDVVSQQLFRTNSSILGQKKKNQRKSRNKKRAQERRLSESENSEAEDRKEKFKKTPDNIQKFSEETDEDPDEKSKMYFKSDLIFDIDM